MKKNICLMGKYKYKILGVVSLVIGLFFLPTFFPKNNIDVLGQVLSTCSDSDRGLDYETSGYVEGVGQNGYSYVKFDVCETGDYEGYLKEMYCNGLIPWAKRYQCPNGCFNGACITQTPPCTDIDGDLYSIEGGLCGEIDCNDSDPHINPGMAEICGNGLDDDCNGLVDQDDPACLICTDNDSDQYFVEGGSCGLIDCDDGDANINPGVSEKCQNGVDDNCNGLVDQDDPFCNEQVNVVVIGWDGAQREHLKACFNKELPECTEGLPNLENLSAGNIINITSTSGASETKPGWAQIFTGYKAEVTGVFNNGVYQPIPQGYTVFEKLENAFGDENITTMFLSNKGVHTGGACIGEWTTKNGLPFIEDLGQPWCLTKFNLDYYENDYILNAEVGNRALALLDLHVNDHFFAFFLFRDPDVTGHVASENSISYSNAINNVDLWLEQIVNRLNNLGIQGKTLVYVVTDHGFDESLDFALNSRHGNSPYEFLATNDPNVVRGGNRMDLVPTWLERFGVSAGAIGDIPAVDGYSLYSYPALSCITEGEAFVDYSNAPTCCPGLSLINMDRKVGISCLSPTGDPNDNTGYCTNCGNGICETNENKCNCSSDCLY